MQTQNTPNYERLEKLANHLLHGKLGHETFDFSKYNNGSFGKYAEERLKYCGTAGCAIGECPFVFEEWLFNSTG